MGLVLARVPVFTGFLRVEGIGRGGGASVSTVTCFTLECFLGKQARSRHCLTGNGTSPTPSAMQMMKQRGVYEGVMMMRALAADNAFVWGLVNASPKDSRTAKIAAPNTAFRTPTSTVTDHSLRAAALHLRHLVPPEGASPLNKLESYTSAVAEVFTSAPPGSVPDSMVADTAKQLTAQYAAAARSVRGALLDKGVMFFTF